MNVPPLLAKQSNKETTMVDSIVNEAPATPEVPAKLWGISLKAEIMDMNLRACSGLLTEIIAHPDSQEHLIIGLRATLDRTIEQSAEIVKGIHAARAAQPAGEAHG
jgi:hypothetical protein